MARIEPQPISIGLPQAPAAAPARAGLAAGALDRTLAWLLLLSLLHGALYLALVPPWQHYDEPTHFEFARLLAYGADPLGALPTDQEGRRAIAVSMARFGFWEPGQTPRLDREYPPGIGFDQRIHPPLYYQIAALPIRLAAGQGVEVQLYAARALSLLFYTLTVAAAWRIVAVLSPDEPLAQAILPLLVALTPAFADIMTAVNNDVLVNFSAAAMLLGCLLLIRDGLRPLPLGLAALGLAAGVMTKRTALLGVALVGLACLWALWRRPLPRWAWALPLLAGLAALPAGFRLTPGEAALLAPRAWLVALDEAYLRLSLGPLLVSLSDWGSSWPVYRAIVPLVFFSFWGRLGWSHISVGPLWDGMILGLCLGALAGLLLRGRGLLAGLGLPERRSVWLLAAAVGLAWLSVLVRAHPLPIYGGFDYLPRGRYMFGALVPAVLLLALGLQALVPPGWRRRSLLGLLGLFVAFSLAGGAGALVGFYYR